MDSKDGIGSMTHFGSFHWYVIHTKPRDEHRVKDHLDGMGIETLLPLCKSYRYPYNRVHPLLNPLFPNYLFARLDLDHHYYQVKWTKGVNRILGAGSEPIPILERAIQILKERMGDDNAVQLLEDIQEGNIVRITSGPLENFVGAFQKGLSSSGRVRILLNVIGMDLPIQIYRWQIKKVA